MAECGASCVSSALVQTSTQESAPGPALRTTGFATQSCSANFREDSNIVTLKSWSDDEDSEDPSDTIKIIDKAGAEAVDNSATDETNSAYLGDSVLSSKRKAEDTDVHASKRCKTDRTLVLAIPTPKDSCRIDCKKKTIRYESTEERFSETGYYFENGLRKVYPYEYTFKSFTKGRWVGEKILDVFSREFRAQNAEEYDRCLKAGSLTVNGVKVEGDYVLKHNDVIANVVHRHEVPVTSDPIEVVHIDRDVVVINKPASVPVHPCGRYRHNTIVFILAKEYNLKNLRTIHRLDRLTSGVLIFCRTPERARELEFQIRSRSVQKEYVCRVEGNFSDEEIECNEPIEVVSYKIGVCRVSPTGKNCSTAFKKLSYNEKTNSSVVLCQPHTGRMHQIRVHLQYVGHPIIRDPLYNHPVFGPEKGKNGNIGKSNQQLIEELIHLHNAENWLGDGDMGANMEAESEPLSNDERSTEITSITDLPSPGQVTKDVSCQTNYDEPDPHCKPSKIIKNENCAECKLKYRDPKKLEMRMYLHALSYKGPDWIYKTNLPAWAEPNWEEES